MSAVPSASHGRVAVALAVALVLASGSRARAEEQVTVGLYAPTAPFRGPSERLEYISKLAAHLAGAAPGKVVVGRVFVRASSLAAAVKRGDVQFAVIDAPYAAARGLPYEILAAATRDGAATTPWMLVSSGRVRGIGDLWEKVVALPQIGSGERAFLANSLLEGEVEASWFSRVTSAPDTLSALTLVSVGRAHAAVVPAGVSLPAGVTRAFELRSVGWPMFVALPRADRRLREAFRERVRSFSGNVLTGFTSPVEGGYEALRASLRKPRRRGPMAQPGDCCLGVEDLFAGRATGIQMSDLAHLLDAPVPRE